MLSAQGVESDHLYELRVVGMQLQEASNSVSSLVKTCALLMALIIPFSAVMNQAHSLSPSGYSLSVRERGRCLRLGRRTGQCFKEGRATPGGCIIL